ncbi:glutamine synthetase [Arthrobacter sp. cf158]|uniref:glutamine synthetase family protein n=1 Tax=Arthrobacter sp. cf158 TaxID=1761744 RepID=UPI00089C0617|nr:glutamine synthetase family protein [Arthrobacter sp. cf158]SDW91060.1 glutamine synthetase [Arthrobacter sp. cf158]
MANIQLPTGTHTVELVFADAFGVLRGKRVPASQWDKVAETGVAASSAALIWGARCELRDDSPAGGMAEGFPDMKLIPRGESLRRVPWKPGVVQIGCDIYTMDGARHPLCARNALVNVVHSFADLGYQVKAAIEMEFYLLNPETAHPRGTDVNCYGIADPQGYGPVLEDIQTLVEEYGIAVEAWNYEYAPGQFEVNVRYDDALKAAEDGVLLKNAVKEIALKHGLVATFMGKPFGHLAGSGMHVHQSLWKDGTNAFASDDSRHLSDLGRHYLGGLQKHIRDLTLFGSPSLNDFKRRQEGSFCPTRATWGDDNRTVAIRVITADSCRIEQRDAAASANPYLVLAAQLAAGREGIAKGIEPPAKCEGNSYTDAQAEMLPQSAVEAADLLQGSEFAHRAFPPLLTDTFVDTARWEYRQLAGHVSDFERARFVGVI